jgi:hypothetical protein
MSITNFLSNTLAVLKMWRHRIGYVLFDSCTLHRINKCLWWTVVLCVRQTDVHTYRELFLQPEQKPENYETKTACYYFSHFCIIPLAKMFFWRKEHCIYICVCVCVRVCVWERVHAHVESNHNFLISSAMKIFLGSTVQFLT